MVRSLLSGWCLVVLLAASGCGESSPGPSGMDMGAPDIYPTRYCILAGVCGTCYGDTECWEGYQPDSCASRPDTPNYSSMTCPQLGFPVNCSGQNLFELPGTVCEPDPPPVVDPPRPSTGPGSGCGCVPRGELCEDHEDCTGADMCYHEVGLDSPKRCYATYDPNDDECSSCLSSCRGLPGCCTGVGCICDSACP